MIRTVIFDLDGTLVQTERLKAISYARAAVKLCPHEVTEEEVTEAYKDVVGQPRPEVASSLAVHFDLEHEARNRMEEYGVSTPWQAFVQVRLEYYEEMISDPETLRDNQWPHNVELLQVARDTGCKTALATMSGHQRTQQVLEALRLTDAFDFVAPSDDMEEGKPDPEIHFLVCEEVEIPHQQSLAIEDSPAGVRAALAGDLRCIVVTTPFTRKKIHEQDLLEDRWVIDDPGRLPEMVRGMIEGSGQEQ